MRRRRTATTIAAGVIAASAVLTGCGGNQQAAERVTVSEWVVQPKSAKVKAGSVRITVDNVGSRTHELVVFRGAKASLPLKADGSVSERDAESRIVGEVAGVAPGRAKFKDFSLKAGEYTIFCNIEQQESGGTVSHFVEGMVSSIRVG